MNQIPTLICVDVEPDMRRPDLNPRAAWKGFEETLRVFEELRSRSDRESIVCWFLRMDPQIEIVHGSALWVIHRYGAQIDSLRSAGDEIGLHTHAWRRVGDKWVTDNGDQQWVNECVRMSFHAYESAFGFQCRSFRFGDHWMNNETFDLVESLGAHYDLTVEPGVRPNALADQVPSEVFTGRFPDYTNVPREPYKPAKQDFKNRGEAHDQRATWVIPVSTTLPHWPAAPFYRRVVWRTRYGPRLYYPLSLALDPDQLRPVLEQDVVDGENSQHRCVVLRTDALSDRSRAKYVRENLELLMSLAARGRIQLTAPARLVAATSAATTGA